MPGQPYGSPPPYPASSPYGYPAPPPGGSNGKRTAWIIGGIGGAIILLVVIVVVFVVGVGSPSDKRAIKQVYEDVGKSGSVSNSIQFFCTADQKLMKKYIGRMDPELLEIEERPNAEITEVKVDGDRAIATITTDGGPDVTAYFRKEDGDWKLCNSDDPSVIPPS
jgi:hypothetical protein